MIRKATLLLLLCIGFSQLTKAQYCGFESAQQRLLAEDPTYAQQMRELTANWQNWLQASKHPTGRLVNTGTKLVYEIPVVIHVIHTGDVVGSIYNPTDLQLQNMIAYLNKTYDGVWSGYPDSNSGGVTIPIQFALAKRDTNCNATTGIVRVDGRSLSDYEANGISNGSTPITGVPDASVKALSKWPNSQYYNIWVVNKINGNNGTSGTFTAGYAYLAPAPASVDGTVMLATQAMQGRITLPHEVGHAMTLLHTFEGGTTTTCPSNANCNVDGDQICDTEPERQSLFNCPNDPNPCTGLSYNFVQHNFMDYSSCQDRFTPGQRQRMIMGLMQYRGNLIGSLGGKAPSVGPGAACPTAIANSGNNFNAGPREVKIADNFTSTYINAPYVYLDYSSSGYNGDGTAYLDLSCKQQADLVTGQTYQFTVKSGPSAEKVRVYIDYNNNNSFEAAELVYTHDGTTGNEVNTFALTLPTFSTMPTLATCVPLRMRVISDRTNGIVDPCLVQTGQAEDYTVVINGVGSSGGSVAISLPENTDTTCIGSLLTFTAQPSSGVDLSTVSYMWFVNNVPNGFTTSTYTSASLVNNDVVFAKMYFRNPCGNMDSTTSNSITVFRAGSLMPRIAVALTAGNNPGCAGYPVTFTATPFNGGTNPTYLWMVNGNPAGSNSPTFTSSTLNNGEVVTCRLTSDLTCATPTTALSEGITIAHQTLVADINIIQVSPSPLCFGRNATFMAQITNAGMNPTYQWYINNAAVTGANGITFTSNTLNNNDILQCVLNAPDACVTNHLDTSNAIIVSIGGTSTPSISASLIQGNNPGCLDSVLVFGGNAINFGVNPNFTWLVNGVPVGTGVTFSTTILQNGDIVRLRVSQTDGFCYTSDTLYSDPINILRTVTPSAPHVSLIGNLLVANNATTGTIQWYGPNGLIPGESSKTYHPLEKGTYYATLTIANCTSEPSNNINISLLLIGMENVKDAMTAYPNPSNGQLTLDWGKAVNMKVNVYNSIGQGLKHIDVTNETKKMIDLSAFPSGTYFIVSRSEAGSISTISVTLTK